MTMGDLYEEMKASLKFFGLAFSQMHEVSLAVVNGNIAFSHGGRTITLDDGFENLDGKA